MSLSPAKKIAVASVAILVLLVVSAVIAWYVFGREFLANSRREAQLVTEEGRQFGRTADTQSCLTRALGLAADCDGGGLSCEIRARAFFGGCIAQVGDIAVACSSLPRYEDRLARLSWELNLCTSLGYEQTGGCQRVVNELAIHCAKQKEHAS